MVHNSASSNNNRIYKCIRKLNFNSMNKFLAAIKQSQIYDRIQYIFFVKLISELIV